MEIADKQGAHRGRAFWESDIPPLLYRCVVVCRTTSSEYESPIFKERR
jgi:hypothetical protein